jgi:hypothetical protein
MYIFLFIAIASAARTTCTVSQAKVAAHDPMVAFDVYVYDRNCAAEDNKATRARWENLEYDLTGLDCDHIIDEKNVPGLADGCARDIAANKIPVGSSWNRAAGQLCWADAEAEKRAVYGDAIVNNALAAVRECCGQEPAATNINYIILAVVAGILVVSAGVSVVVCAVRGRIVAYEPPAAFWV